ncbi:MAG: Rrf2 family transcriptional regulator [Halanaerobiales bacterium]
MKVSTRGRYGLRAMIELSKNDNSGAIPLRIIAEKQKISEQYLEQLFVNLRNSGLVKSVRGANGGYLLKKSAEEITVREILVALEGPISIVDCVEDESLCDFSNKCATHELWIELRERIEDLLGGITLEDLKQRSLQLVEDD